MRFTTVTLFAFVLIVLGATTAQARDPGVNARQRRQKARTIQGVKSGELTKSEAKSLAAEQRAIRKEEREFKSDGKLTTQERKELHQDLKESSRDIYREKHDDDKRE